MESQHRHSVPHNLPHVPCRRPLLFRRLECDGQLLSSGQTMEYPSSTLRLDVRC